MPLFKGKQTIMPDARADGQPVDDTVRPGTYQLTDPESGQAYSVVWWDPLLLASRSGRRPRRASRGTDLEDREPRQMSPPIAPTTINGASAESTVQASGSVASMRVADGDRACGEAAEGKADQITIEDAGFGVIRPSGKRFGTLVHAVLATLPLQRDSR